jgi:hypothetical protein
MLALLLSRHLSMQIVIKTVAGVQYTLDVSEKDSVRTDPTLS